MCLNARSIINKKNELNIMVDDIKPHIIGITESWAHNDITEAELGLEGYVMFRKDRIEKGTRSVIVTNSAVRRVDGVCVCMRKEDETRYDGIGR